MTIGVEGDMKCSFCHRPLASLDDSFVEFYGREPESEPTLVYPRPHGGQQPVVMFTHGTCGPDTGYAVPFDRLLAEPDWEDHLTHKGWWCHTFAAGLSEAKKAAQAFG